MSKKVTKTVKEFRQYELGDPVLGKVRGYPPWPGVVVDPSDAPPAVLHEQPPNKKATFYCILFFPMGDYAWLHSKDLSSLKRHEIEGFLADETKKRNGELREGYRIALDPQPWMTNRTQLVQAAQLAEEDAQVDQLESEKEEDEEDSSKKAKTTSKKRKRESAEPTKAPKKAPKPKKSSAEPTKKKAASTAGRPKKNGAKSKAMVESEDEGDAAEAEEEDEDAGPSKRKPSPPAAKKLKRDKDDDGDDAKSDDPQSIKVRDWRHKLQKTFLSNKALPKAEAMPEIDQLFTTVEVYNDMTIEQLQFSKIGKVMRHIAALSDDKVPPRDEEFKFRARAKALVDKWHQILNANKAANGSPTTSVVGGQANGKAKHPAGGAAAAAAKKDAEEVTQATKNIDLNGEGESPADAAGDADQDAPAEADTSMLGDVTMSEADA
ncbi:hypothetical protein GALMADRAFT_216707 [Galerina marginata CBS 339.88]|uniref:PWWP domain-containing protein n=1 Tax=Galerina marginata (strain CBS 339.88) TaxID=685588 RepID=A0A067SH51_GALM3|nr:hypothetical protein GALMADRAFT_216707 [Galerina marginata CBS 339.88]